MLCAIVALSTSSIESRGRRTVVGSWQHDGKLNTGMKISDSSIERFYSSSKYPSLVQ